MVVRGIIGLMSLVGLGALLGPQAVRAQEKVYRNVSSEKLESILKGMDQDYKKTPGKKDGIFLYDYERNNYKIRLHNYEGKDLWVDAIFNDKTTLEEVNGWNVRAKFSRAVLVKAGDKENIYLESQLDCVGGVTEGMVRQFITRFDGEIREFVKYLTK
jgi:hypothetical protein